MENSQSARRNVSPSASPDATPGLISPASFPGAPHAAAPGLLPAARRSAAAPPAGARTLAASRRWSPAAQRANIDMAERYLADPKVQAFLSLIRNEETGDDYSKLVGGSHFDDFSQHPGIYNKKYNSTSAGAYQFNKPTWDDVSPALGLTDFSPHSQDLAAVHLLNQLGAVDELLSGDVAGAINSAGRRWDTLPKADGMTISGRSLDVAPLVRSYNDRLGRGHP